MHCIIRIKHNLQVHQSVLSPAGNVGRLGLVGEAVAPTEEEDRDEDAVDADDVDGLISVAVPPSVASAAAPDDDPPPSMSSGVPFAILEGLETSQSLALFLKS